MQILSYLKFFRKQVFRWKKECDWDIYWNVLFLHSGRQEKLNCSNHFCYNNYWSQTSLSNEESSKELATSVGFQTYISKIEQKIKPPEQI